MIFAISSVILFLLVNYIAAGHVLNNIDKVLAGDKETINKQFKFSVYMCIFNLTTVGSWIIIIVKS